MTVRKAVILGVVLELLIGIAAGAFYFKFYIFTPTYSLRAMQKDIQTGNVEDLQRRVDLDAIFQGGSQKLSELVPQGEPVYASLKDGSFGRLCKEEFLTYVQTGKWPEPDKITAESSFQDKIGLKTVSFRSLEYVYRDPPPGEEDKKDETLTDKLLSYILTKINDYMTGEESEEAAKEEVAIQEDEGPIRVTAGVRVYEPNFGDTYIINLKLQRQEDGSWRLYDIENYGRYADELIKQNDRDYVRYKEKVRFILTSTQEKLDELKAEHPENDLDWVFEARKIFEESYKRIDELNVPIAGGYLNELLRERKEISLSMMESYYDVASHSDNMNDAKARAEEARKEGKRRPAFNAAVWNNRLAKYNEKLSGLQKQWAENKSKLEKVVGGLVDRAAAARQTAASMRNNDDGAVRAANYPGAADNNGDSYSLLGGENLPEISAYGNEAQ